MATKKFTLSGEARWCKVWKPDEKYGKYSLDLKLDDKGLKTFQSMGLKNGVKVDEDNNTWVTFRRDPAGTVWTNNKAHEAGAPKVTGVDEGTLIGNGSEATIVVSVYDYDNKFGKGKGSRLESVKVNKLVEYVKPEPTYEEVAPSSKLKLPNF